MDGGLTISRPPLSAARTVVVAMRSHNNAIQLQPLSWIASTCIEIVTEKFKVHGHPCMSLIIKSKLPTHGPHPFLNPLQFLLPSAAAFEEKRSVPVAMENQFILHPYHLRH